MPAEVIDVRIAEDARDVIHRAVEALSKGRLVAIPTETVYGVAASALDEGAVERLKELKGREVGHPFAFAIRKVNPSPSLPGKWIYPTAPTVISSKPCKSLTP